ncbi:MAG: alkaline phosphatase D family protein [Opitutales bacterium]
MYKNLLLFVFALTAAAQAQAAALLSGPMLTGAEMREARIWVQTDQPALIRIAYNPSEGGGGQKWSLPVETEPSLANTATTTLTEIEPGKTYSYRIEVNGQLQAASYQFTSPAFYHDRTPPPDFTIAVGGAHYRIEEAFEPPYQILGAGYDIFESIAATKPALMLWLGNTAHLRVSDWSSRSGYLKRFSHARATPELAKLLAGTPHYATWGEADYGTAQAGARYSYRDIAEESFRAFWPRPVEVPGLEGIATRFRYADVDFFMLDTRSYRNDTPTSSQTFEILGAEQLEWLRQELIRSTATFKVLCAGAPILNPAKSRSNLSYAEREHTRLLEMLRSEKIAGLFFISGGKYYGELTRLVHASSYNLYDLTVGPLTANPRDNEDELNFFRMPGSSTFERHFALIDFTGPEEARRIAMRVMSLEGQELWRREIPASALQPPE